MASFVSMLLIIGFTSSRTVQAVCVLTTGIQILFSLQGKQRLAALFVAFSLLTTIAVTDNPLSNRFKGTLTEKSALRTHGYPDDRVAFWHVFSEMIKERPIIGHGIDLNTKYRTSYYEKIGLGEFKKKYSAHNMFIQITAETGFVGLLVFIAFLSSLFSMFFRAFDDSWLKMVSALTLFGFILASLTQNAFQDSIVKNALILWIATSFDILRIKDDSKPI